MTFQNSPGNSIMARHSCLEQVKERNKHLWLEVRGRVFDACVISALLMGVRLSKACNIVQWKFRQSETKQKGLYHRALCLARVGGIFSAIGTTIRLLWYGHVCRSCRLCIEAEAMALIKRPGRYVWKWIWKTVTCWFCPNVHLQRPPCVNFFFKK